jgi:hypothetical protein
VTTLALISLYTLGLQLDQRKHLALERAYAGTPLLTAIQKVRAKTWACQDELGVGRTRASQATPLSTAYRRWVLNRWQTRRHAYCSVLRALRDPASAIRAVFGDAGNEALVVFGCESGLSTTAQNGQYLGLAQMGDYARDRYGHSSTALGQVKAAYAYYREDGWGPWECAEIEGVQ